MENRTLVTGGTGLVGFQIISSLLKRKRKVRVLVRSMEKGKRILPAGVELAQGDILNLDSLKKAADGCHVIYHAAGWPEQWMRDTSTFYKVNVEGTRNM
ncbi:MAG: NAD-dependent epimerase/dehydratase family protein, partial [bacterium]